MWQFGGETNQQRSPYLAGQIVDQDYCYYDYPSVIKNAGLNGYSKSGSNPQPTPTKESNEEIADEVINGSGGNGEDRKNRLEAAGYNYRAIQDIVNAKLGINKEPTKEYYTIQRGDNLTKIANKFGTSVNQLVAWNGIKNPNLIYAGQKIRVK